MTVFVCTGDVRGQCVHQHRTLGAAVKCLDKDRRDCRSLGGGAYSDRRIVAVEDGRERELTESEHEDSLADVQ